MTILNMLALVLGLLNLVLSINHAYRVDWKKQSYRVMNILSGLVSVLWVIFSVASSGISTEIVRVSVQHMADFAHLVSTLFMTLVIIHIQHENKEANPC